MRCASKEDSPEQWLDSVASFLAGKPPVNWIDEHLDEMRLRLETIATRFLATEAVLDARDEGGEGEDHVVRIAVSLLGQKEEGAIVALPAEAMGGANQLKACLLDAVEDSESEVDVALSAIVGVVKELLAKRSARDAAETVA